MEEDFIMMHTYTFELDDLDNRFAKAYTSEIGKSIGEFAKEAMLEAIEDVMDLRAAEKAWTDYLADPVTYTLDEVESEIMKNAV